MKFYSITLWVLGLAAYVSTAPSEYKCGHHPDVGHHHNRDHQGKTHCRKDDDDSSYPGISSGSSGSSGSQSGSTGSTSSTSNSKIVPGGKTGRATTTLYDASSGAGACGCFNRSAPQSPMFPWQYQTSGDFYTAAGSETMFGETKPDEHNWCGNGCGKCYELTSSGKAACDTCGRGSEVGKKITVMVTNLCPSSPHYCTPRGSTNEYGFENHFDIMSGSQSGWKLAGGDWDNPVVDFVEVECPTDYAAKYQKCECAAH